MCFYFPWGFFVQPWRGRILSYLFVISFWFGSIVVRDILCMVSGVVVVFNLVSLALDVLLWLLPPASERMCDLQLLGAVCCWYQCCLVPVGQWRRVLLYPGLFLLTFGKGMLKFSALTVDSLFLPSVLSGVGWHICSSAVWCIHIYHLLFLFAGVFFVFCFFCFFFFFDPSNLM